jgi:RimJ/RimL family protein N-acetyltransferase
MTGTHCRLERLAVRHAAALFAADALDETGESWTYLPYGPFPDVDAYTAWVAVVAASEDPLFFAILDAAGSPVGVASYLRVSPDAGSIEVGHLHYSPLLQRTPAATEAMYLMMRRVFDELGYRRYEWKCNALNAASMRAAERLGFTYEGTFRNSMVVKGRNRDTAWFSVVGQDWPVVRAGFTAWLDPGNRDAAGCQRRSLAELRAAHAARRA